MRVLRPLDREVFALALPALGALAAEPLYVLVGTAIVGHLGTTQLAVLAIAAGDTRFLMWGMLASAAIYVPVALLALDRGWGIEGVWWGLAGLIAMRALTCGARFLGNRWVLTGAPA